MTVLVTGANGFIGRHVVAALLARGHEVRVLVRSSAEVASIAWIGSVDVARGDLDSRAGLEPALDGIECVVHLAAPLRGTNDEHRAVTVEGTRHLLELMARCSACRLVLASSFAVYDSSRVGTELDESSPLLSREDSLALGPYAAAKCEQEQVARRLSADGGLGLTVLRPGFVWGRGRELPACLGLGLGPAWVVVAPRSRPCLSYVENCADLFATAVEDPRAAAHTFNAVDSDDVTSWRSAGDHLRLVRSARARLPVPYALASGLIPLAHSLLGSWWRRMPEALVPAQFEARFRPVRTEPRAAREILGWHPPWTYEEALRRCSGVVTG